MTLESDGSYSVHCIVKSNTAVNAALTAYFSSNKADFIEAQKQKARELEEATKAKLMQSAANESQIEDAA